MTKLTITRGLPGAGKTTWARELAAQTGACRVNRDDMRMMMFGRKVDLGHQGEQAVTTACHALAKAHLCAGRDVVADDTNLRPLYVREWRKLARATGAEFEVHEMPCSVDDSIARQLQRPEGDRVPEDAIRRMHAKFLPKGAFLPVPDQAAADAGEAYQPGPGTPEAIMVDIDGTVALMGDRSPYDTTTVHLDQPNRAVIQIVDALAEIGYGVIFLSGRDESCREATEEWLRGHFEYGFELHMRPAGDRRRDSIVKLELFDQHVRHRYNVLAAFDDRNQVVEMWRSLGLTCLQVADGDF